MEKSLDAVSIPPSPLDFFEQPLTYVRGKSSQKSRGKSLVNINNPRINNQITAPELRVLGGEDENLGVMSREAALKLSAERGLDLIEISPTANPPVARIMSFDKFRYLEIKKWKKQRAQQKNKELKQIQVGVAAAKNDLEVKVKKLEEFLGDGHPVVIVLVLRGRQKANKDWARFKLQEFLKMISLEYQMVMEPRFGGRGLTTQIVKK